MNEYSEKPIRKGTICDHCLVVDVCEEAQKDQIIACTDFKMDSDESLSVTFCDDSAQL